MKNGYWVYDIDWILSNGFCYRSTLNLTKGQLNDARRTAKVLGETIKVTEKRYIKY